MGEGDRRVIHEQTVKAFSDTLAQGWVCEIDHTEYDGYRVSFRLPPGEYRGFWSADTLEEVIEKALLNLPCQHCVESN